MAVDHHPPSDSRDAIEAEWHQLYRDVNTWNFQLGPIRLSVEFNSMRLVRYFVGFHLLVAVAGAVLVFLGDGAGSRPSVALGK